jgi:hypothetical protein
VARGVLLGAHAIIILDYPSKKVLRAEVGRPLRYIETSMFGPEYLENGTFFGANRPSVTGQGRFFCAKVTMENGLIAKVH